jgi:hypothetical protein
MDFLQIIKLWKTSGNDSKQPYYLVADYKKNNCAFYTSIPSVLYHLHHISLENLNNIEKHKCPTTECGP